MVDLNGGRGWLNPAEAASIHRIDRHLGRLLQISEAGRSFFQQERFYKAWLNGTGNYALSPYGPPRGNGPSVHQSGGAIDTDDWVRYTWLLNEHGWFQTVFWPDGSLREGWHFEYDASRDQHINDSAPAPAGVVPTIPEEDEEEDEDMALKGAHYKNKAGTSIYILFNEVSGFYVEHSGVDGGTYNNPIAKNWGTGTWPVITEGHALVIKRSLDAIRRTAVTGSLSVDITD